MSIPINQRGFTLLEVVAAIVAFAFGSLALYRLQAATIMGNSFSNELTRGNALAQDRMERLMALPYLDPGKFIRKELPMIVAAWSR